MGSAEQPWRFGRGESILDVMYWLGADFLIQYTRYRRWTRIAVVFEEVESVLPGDIGIKKEVVETQEILVADTASQSSDSSLNPPDSPLRQRLRNALHKGT